MNLKTLSWKKILRILFWSQLSILLCVTLGFISKEEDTMPCTSLKITVDNLSSGISFIEPEDVKEVLNSKAIKAVGTPVGKIRTRMLERMLNENPYVLNAEVFLNINGELSIDVKQRTPLFRIINFTGEHFYIDVTGSKMPLSEQYSSRVIVATGYIPGSYMRFQINPMKESDDTLQTHTLADSLFYLIKKINENEFMLSLTEQVYVNAEHEFEIVPKISTHTVIIGNISSLDDKFARLLLFYKNGMSKTGWDIYNTVNLKYNNQVICTRNPDKKIISNKTIKK